MRYMINDERRLQAHHAQRQCWPQGLLCAFSMLMPSSACTQTAIHTVSIPAYDVVSIVPNKAGDSGEMGVESHDATFTATNVDLTTLLINAFDIKPDLIFGRPSWIAAKHWNVQAKITDPDLTILKQLSKAQRRSMLVDLLTDRFHLKTHFETRQLPIYSLVIAQQGPKFTQSQKQNEQDMGGMSSGDGEVILQAYPLSALTFTLSSILHRTVIDDTGLTDHYDLHLTWTPDSMTANQDNDRSHSDHDSSIFSAIRNQLGLKLVSAKGPVPVLVIDHIDFPTSN